ncbi:MAG TPA: hydrogenase formation protein HypD [Patescibacteria group bacterium]|nr:hydrogenase formation protein HypD [Patescibacteria group bacterium]
MSQNNVLDSFHDPAIAGPLAAALRTYAVPRPVRFMHVCGTHEHAIARAGIRGALPAGLRLVAGPGCPVCVCPAADIDLAIEAARREDVIVATFGDMFRVPSSERSLEEMKAAGCDIRIVYSPMDAVRIAHEHPEREVVFMAVGFETTAGPIAAALSGNPPPNFSIMPSLRLIPPALTFLLERDSGSLDGFLLPGHVSTVLGRDGYLFLERRYNVPGVIAGFEPIDIIRAILELLSQATAGPPYRVVNQYRRIVSEGGNEKARRVIDRVFEVCDATWRGIGVIPSSGLALRESCRHLDARIKLGLEGNPGAIDVPPGCICHEVILGDAEPEQCPLFGTRCMPRNPQGPCMVSNEGTCRARYQYRTIKLPEGK